MRIYSAKSNPNKGNTRLRQLIGTDLWFKCFYRNEMYWYNLIDVTDTDYIGHCISDYRVNRIQRNLTTIAPSEICNNLLSNPEQYPIRNFKPRFSEALQNYYVEVLTTAELFNLEADT